MLISFIIPIYNEEKRVGKAVKELEIYLKNVSFKYEVLFVDDGSFDRTISKIKSLKPKFKYRILSYQPNHGKGYAIKIGMKEAAGDFRHFLDVDMSTPIGEFNKFLPLLDSKTILIGSRKRKGALVKKHQPFIREKMGQIFTLLARLLVNRQVTDFTCGFKLFPKTPAEKIFPQALIDRWSYDAEILFLAKKYGYRIKEIPVSWVDDPRTRVTLFKDSLQSFTDLLKINLFNLLNKYQ